MGKQQNRKSSSRFPVHIYSARTRKPNIWPYWVFIPLCSISYGLYILCFTLMAWGYRGEPKPDWMDTAFVLAWPGQLIGSILFFVPPPIPELLPGALLGWLFALVVASCLDN